MFIVCDVLCFLKYKFGKTNVKLLKSALVDYYDVEILSKAYLETVSYLETFH